MLRSLRFVLTGAALALVIHACGGTTSVDTTSASGASSASGATSGSSSVSGSGGASTSTSSATSTSAGTGGSGGGCGDCGGFSCCNGQCVNENNDIRNCGGCNSPCTGPTPYCDHGACGKPPCTVPGCGAGTACCGGMCCMPGELCCDVPGPVGEMLECSKPTDTGTCPMGCIQCMCASPDTPIATPTGERRIADLRPGDLVYSVENLTMVPVPIRRVGKVAVHDHHVVRLALDSGRVLEISAGHPTSDGRTFADLHPGDRLDGARVVSAELIPYVHAFTHDILPDSSTGTYVAAGVLIGSTLHGDR